jgi:hypothetical protein
LMNLAVFNLFTQVLSHFFCFTIPLTTWLCHCWS